MDKANKTRYGLYKAYRDKGKDHEVICFVMDLNKSEQGIFPHEYEIDKRERENDRISNTTRK